MAQGRVALVTGGTRGIGAAITKRLAEEGAVVAAGFSSNQERAKSFAEELKGDGADISLHQGNVGEWEDCQRTIQEVLDQHGRLDILVNNAGITQDRPIWKMTVDDWHKVLRVNLSGAFYAIRAALPFLRASRGLVVLIASVSGRWPDASGPAYQATKAGMVELGHAAGFEEHVNGVRFSSILPGIVDTPILDNRPEPPPREVRDAALKPEDVAQACLFLATLPSHAYVPELTMVPTAIQALGKTSTATPPV